MKKKKCVLGPSLKVAQGREIDIGKGWNSLCLGEGNDKKSGED